MALPTAPLGSMAGINLPSHIPTTIVPDRNPLTMALAAFLSGAAQTAGGKLTSNALSRDFAAQNGQQPATFMERLVGGPVVGAEQNSQNVQNKAMSDRLDKEIMATNLRLDKSIGASTAENAARINASAADTDKRLAAGKSEFDARLTQQKSEFDATRKQGDKRIEQQDTALEQNRKIDEARMSEINAKLTAMVTENRLTAARADAIAAEMAKTGEEARSMKGMNDEMERRRNPQQKPTAANPLAGAKMPKTAATLPSAEEVMASKPSAPTAANYSASRANDAATVTDPVMQRLLGIAGPDPMMAGRTVPQVAGTPVPPQAAQTPEPIPATVTAPAPDMSGMPVGLQPQPAAPAGPGMENPLIVLLRDFIGRPDFLPQDPKFRKQ